MGARPLPASEPASQATKSLSSSQKRITRMVQRCAVEAAIWACPSLVSTSCACFKARDRFCRSICLALGLGLLCVARLPAHETGDGRDFAYRLGWSEEINESVVAVRSQKPRRSINFYSEEKEERLGQELAKKIESYMPMIVDDLVLEYVNRLADRISEQSDSRSPLIVKVFTDNDDNASSLPGGHIYVTSALVLKAHSEAELAGVIAHEVGHIAARHRTQKWTRKRIWNFPFLAIEWVGPLAPTVEQLPRALSAIPSHKFNRGCEYEADSLGIQYVSRAGYDPRETVHILERWATQEKHRSIFRRMIDDQPPLPSRVRRARAQIRDLRAPQGEYLIDTPKFHEVQKHLQEILEK